MLLRQANWKTACSKKTEHIKQQQKQVLSAPKGNLVPSSVCQWGTGNGGSEQPGNKAGKGDTIAVTTWAETLLRNTIVTKWAAQVITSYYLGQGSYLGWNTTTGGGGGDESQPRFNS